MTSGRPAQNTPTRSTTRVDAVPTRDHSTLPFVNQRHHTTLATRAQGPHPFPSRTRPLSPAAPMVLRPRGRGRVGRRRHPQRGTLHRGCPVCRSGSPARSGSARRPDRATRPREAAAPGLPPRGGSPGAAASRGRVARSGRRAEPERAGEPERQTGHPRWRVPRWGCRRRPTLPRPLGRSTIGAAGLNGRVRDGNGCGPCALVASVVWCRWLTNGRVE